MRFLLAAVVFVFTGYLCHAAHEPFYVAGKDGIYHGSLDSESGEIDSLKRVQELAAPPLYIAQSPTLPVLYAGAGKEVLAFEEAEDGALKPIGKLDINGKNLCYLSCDSKGKFLIAAEYSNHCITVVSLGNKGEPQKAVDFLAFGGSGPNKERQEASHPHSICFDPDNRHVYMCDLGTDRVWTMNFDATAGKLSQTPGVFLNVKPGCGPRHMAFSPDGNLVYVDGELGANLMTLKRKPDSGMLLPKDDISVLTPDRPATDGGGAEVMLHPSGKWLYVANRLGNTIAVFSIAADGKATLVEDAPSVADFVFSFWNDPTGRWLLAAGYKDNRVVVQKIDQETGKLTETKAAAPIPEPLCVLFVPSK